MDMIEHLLTCVLEECSEVQKAVTKALRFGLEDGYPGSSLTNRCDLERELSDLLAVVDMCIEAGLISYDKVFDRSNWVNKQRKVRHYMEYAKDIGRLVPGPHDSPENGNGP